MDTATTESPALEFEDWRHRVCQLVPLRAGYADAAPHFTGTIDDALGLWTGTAMAGVPGEAIDRERARLERKKLGAERELLQLKLDLGEHAEVVAEAPLLIQANRLDETLYEIYLVALYRSGRRAEALAVYRAVYDLLAAELGIVPGAGLRAIQQLILRGDVDMVSTGPPDWRLRRGEQTAVDKKVGSGHVRGPITGQHDDKVRHLVRLREASTGYCLCGGGDDVRRILP